MRIKEITILTILTMLLSVLPFNCEAAEVQSVETATLTLHITGLKNNKGQVVALVFNNPDGFPECPDKAIMKPSTASIKKISVKRRRDKYETTIIIPDIPKGQIAIGFMHDENNNLEMEYGKVLWWHTEVPMEGIGVSVLEKMKKKPEYEQCKFYLNKDTEIKSNTLYLPKLITLFMRKYKKSDLDNEE